MRLHRPYRVAVLLLSLPLLVATVATSRVVGKNPGKIEGRWLDVDDQEDLSGYKGVYVGEVTTDMESKQESHQKLIDEQLLEEKLRNMLLDRLEETGVLGEVLESAPDEGAADYLRLDCTLQVDPGSRAARYVVGMGAGKSRSILEIRLVDHASNEQLGLYHGHGTGTGMGFKIGGGNARKMTEDDIQENTKNFVKLLRQFR